MGCHFLYTGYRTQSHPDRAASTVHYYSSSYRTATLSLMQICYKYATLPVWKHCRYIRTSVSCLQCDIAHKVTTNTPWSLHCKRYIVGKLCSIVSISGIAIGHGITLFWQSRHNDSVNMVCGCMTLTIQLDAHADSNAN